MCPSSQGEAVLDALHALDHPTADEVFLHVRTSQPRVSLGTVYRHLERLVEEGQVRTREGRKRRYDANARPHVHIHDAATDRLVDAAMPPGLLKELKELADAYLTALDGWTIELEGTLKEGPT